MSTLYASLPLLYRQTAASDSLLRADTLLFGTDGYQAASPWGVAGRLMPEAAFRLDVVATGVLLSLLLVLILRRSYTGSLWNNISGFFLPHQSRYRQGDDHYTQEWKCIITAILSSLLFAMTTITAIISFYEATLLISPWILALVFTAVFLIYLIFKQLLYHFVHDVFFSQEEQQLWREAYVFIFTTETLFAFPMLLCFVYLQPSIKFMLIFGAILLLFVKILLLFKCFSTFFEKKHGVLQLFVYFCTLEAAPLLVLWKIIVEITLELSLI
ncbi:MAG: DUF4271 domain-containing protein [Bacteroidales bacterium]|nr:DUF4271 domain-containing protein [Bacteroidales bacterium]